MCAGDPVSGKWVGGIAPDVCHRLPHFMIRAHRMTSSSSPGSPRRLGAHDRTSRWRHTYIQNLGTRSGTSPCASPRTGSRLRAWVTPTVPRRTRPPAHHTRPKYSSTGGSSHASRPDPQAKGSHHCAPGLHEDRHRTEQAWADRGLGGRDDWGRRFRRTDGPAGDHHASAPTRRATDPADRASSTWASSPRAPDTACRPATRPSRNRTPMSVPAHCAGCPILPRSSRRPYPARDHPLASGRRARMAGEADTLAEHRLRAGGQLT
jgi:hypothetical protein